MLIPNSCRDLAEKLDITLPGEEGRTKLPMPSSSFPCPFLLAAYLSLPLQSSLSSCSLHIALSNLSDSMAEAEAVDTMIAEPSASNFLDNFFGHDTSEPPDIYSLLVPFSLLASSPPLLFSSSPPPSALQLFPRSFHCPSVSFSSFRPESLYQAPRTEEELAEYNSDDEGGGAPEISSEGQASVLSFHLDQEGR